METKTPFEEGRMVSLAEVKSMLTKAQQERTELTYEQKLALEHSLRFARLPLGKTEDLVKDLKALAFVPEIFAYKLADLCPTEPDDLRAIFAKAKVNIGDNEIKQILETVGKYYVSG